MMRVQFERAQLKPPIDDFAVTLFALQPFRNANFKQLTLEHVQAGRQAGRQAGSQ